MNPLSPLTRVLLGAALRAHPGRTVVGILAIAVGVAMGYAVYLINHAALVEFSQAVRVLSGQADLEVRGPQSGFDEHLYARLARLPGVAAASPVVAARMSLPGHRETLDVLGVDVFRAMAVSPGLVGRAPDPSSSRLAHLDPSAVFLSPGALAWLGLRPGDTLRAQAGAGMVAFRVAGTLPVANPGLRLGVMDIGAAQWRFGQLGRLQRIDLRLQPGVDVDAFRKRVAALLPPGVAVFTPADTQRVTADLSRAYRVNLDVLALVALFTGAFLVYSGQALSIVSRRSQLALLRALGMTRAALWRLVLAESLILGAAGAVLGVLLGTGLAAVALHYGGGDLGGGYFSGAQPTVRVTLASALAFAALGVAASVLGGLVPARAASRARPAMALKAGDDDTSQARRRASGWALIVVAGGFGLAHAGPVAGVPVFAYLAIGAFVIGAILGMPGIAHRVLGAVPRPRRPVPHLALAQLAAAPGRVAIGLAGVLVSFSLMAAMAIMVNSFRVSFLQWLDTVLPAALYLKAPGNDAAGYFSDRDQRVVAGTPGVARAEFMQTDHLLLNPHLPPVALIVRPVDVRHPGSRLALIGAAVHPAALPPVWVSEAMADLYGMRVGQRIELPLDGRRHAFMVAGVWRDYAHQYGAIVMNADDARRLTGGLRATEAALWLAPGATVDQVARALRARLADPERFDVSTSGDIRARSLRIFDRSFAVTYLLEAVAIFVGLFGVGVGFSAQALARSREFGVLRHVGMTRRQIGMMLAFEGGLLGLLGAGVGLALGWGVAWVLVAVVNPQSFHWTMTLHMPWGLLAVSALALVAAAALTALASGRRTMAVGAVRAVREDW